MIAFKKGDGLILKSGSRMIVAIGEPSNFSYPIPDEQEWFVAAWTEDGTIRLPIQLIAIVEVWRGGQQIYPAELIQPPLF